MQLHNDAQAFTHALTIRNTKQRKCCNHIESLLITWSKLPKTNNIPHVKKKK